MKICIIAAEKEDYAPRRIYDEALKLGHDVYLTDWESVVFRAKESSIFLGDTERAFSEFDLIIPRSKRYEIFVKNKIYKKDLNSIYSILVSFCKKNKIHFLNSAYYFNYQSIDKMSQQAFLFENNLPGIESFYCSVGDAKNMADKFPLVAKLNRGSGGESVFLIKNMKELLSFIENQNRKEKEYFFQEYLEIAFDYRVLVLGGKSLGAIKRVASENEWRTNFSLGGKTEAINDKEVENLAELVAKEMLLDYVGVDILRTKSGELRIIETNALAQFEGFEKAFPKVNVAKELVNYLIKKIKK